MFRYLAPRAARLDVAPCCCAPECAIASLAAALNVKFTREREPSPACAVSSRPLPTANFSLPRKHDVSRTILTQTLLTELVEPCILTALFPPLALFLSAALRLESNRRPAYRSRAPRIANAIRQSRRKRVEGPTARVANRVRFGAKPMMSACFSLARSDKVAALFALFSYCATLG